MLSSVIFSLSSPPHHRHTASSSFRGRKLPASPCPRARHRAACLLNERVHTQTYAPRNTRTKTHTEAHTLTYMEHGTYWIRSVPFWTTRVPGLTLLHIRGVYLFSHLQNGNSDRAGVNTMRNAWEVLSPALAPSSMLAVAVSHICAHSRVFCPSHHLPTPPLAQLSPRGPRGQQSRPQSQVGSRCFSQHPPSSLATPGRAHVWWW